MISFLSGTVHTKFTDSIILLAGPVGYLVTITPSHQQQTTNNQQLNVFVHTHVREENLDLYGFKTLEELALFKMVLNVSGIGPKTALLVVDRGVESVKSAIRNADTSFFSMIPRLGIKNAQKIIIDLKNKLGGLGELDLSGDNSSNDLIEALLGMGYTKHEAIDASRTIPDPKSPLSTQLSFVLRQMDKK